MNNVALLSGYPIQGWNDYPDCLNLAGSEGSGLRAHDPRCL